MSPPRIMFDIDHEFAKLRISAVNSASKIGPYVHDITIGPNKTISEQDVIDRSTINTEDLNSTPKRIVKKDDMKSKRITVTIENESCAYERLVHDYENQRREAVKSVFDNMLLKMVSKRIEVMSNFWQQQESEYERKAQGRRRLEMLILQEWAADDKDARIEQEKLDMENKAHSERMKRLLEKQLEYTKLFERLNETYSNIIEHYQTIKSSICSDKAIESKIYKEYESEISNILSSINAVIENCKTGNITMQDVNVASALENKIANLKNVIRERIQNALNESQNKSVAVEKVPSEPVEEIKPVQIQKESIEKPIKLTQYFSERSKERYEKLNEFLTSYETGYKDLLNDPSLKKFRFDCQKAVNTPVNAISSLSGTHIKDKFEKLVSLLNGEKVMVGDVYVSAAQHPQAKAYCTDLLARKIVRQGELLVSSHPEAAFPIASVAIALWSLYPDFGKLMCAHFYNSCPYLIPMMMPQLAGETDEEFYKKRGYRYSEEGVIEKQDQFLKRISGIYKLYAAMWITGMPECMKMSVHPQNLSHAWQWLAAFVNLNPEIDISATLICDFLTICGYKFMKYYKRQFGKVLKYLITDYMNELGKIDNGGPKTRLDVFIQSLDKNCRIQPPAGLLPDYFW